MQWVFWVTSVAPVVMGLSLSEGIIAGSAIVTAAATATLALFTFVIVRTERTRHAESRQSVHDTIAVHASLLKRSIDKSLEKEWPEDGWTLAYMQKWTYRFQRGYPYLQPRADEIAIKAGQASKEVADAAQTAFYLFYEAAGRINEVQAGEHDEEQARLQLVNAHRELSKCSESLEPLVLKKYRPPPSDLRGSSAHG